MEPKSTEIERLQTKVQELELQLRELRDTVREMHKGHILLLSSLLHELLTKKVEHSTLIKLSPIVQTKGLAALGFSFQEEDSPMENPREGRPDAMERYAAEGITVWDGRTSLIR